MRRLVICTLLLAAAAPSGTDEPVGTRPYEMDWANRHTDDHPPLVDFEDLAGWQVATTGAVAAFARTREQQLWGGHVGRLVYRADGSGADPEVRILPPRPIVIAAPFDAVTCWIYGNNWPTHPTSPPRRSASRSSSRTRRAPTSRST